MWLDVYKRQALINKANIQDLEAVSIRTQRLEEMCIRDSCVGVELTEPPDYLVESIKRYSHLVIELIKI